MRRGTRRSALAVGGLHLLSGLCALVYQVAWLRLMRLVFGASTTASATVLALFMGGIGVGSLLFGRRADRARSPLRLYAKLEAGIAIAAGLSPLLVTLIYKIYIAAGGMTSMGPTLGTAIRLLLAALVLAPATLLMGGTLPAAARAILGPGDRQRAGVAWLYGANTLGAVAGTLLTTFVAIEYLGLRGTLVTAAGLNLLVAAIAWWLGGRGDAIAEDVDPESTTSRESTRREPMPFRLVTAAAAIVGFVFLVLELVWYRMLAPLLGGSSYTFGLILAVALLGIGLGGLLFAAVAPRLDLEQGRMSRIDLFAITCAVEAVAVALPFALGDRIAVWAMLLRPLGDLDFNLLVVSWMAIAGVVVLPAAVVSGFQFPLLVTLLGRGERGVGRDVGAVYAWNTAGAIIGAIAGGFLFVPRLGAVRTWRVMVMLLVLVAVLSAAAAWRRGAQPRRLVPALLGGALAMMLLMALGPTAVWRHTPIGAGGMPTSFDGPNDLHNMKQAVRRAIIWETDGRESAVAIHGLDELSFLINGKADGSAVKDAPTQVMSGLIGAALHPAPKSALVIGLGTGSSAGWLAAVPGMKRVEVYELEPAVREVARRAALVNRNVLEQPNVSVTFGDGRELLLTSDHRHDVIFSEPSNPYRAGVASLFTREFYAAARTRLTDDGIFLQWLQGYDVDAQVVRTVIATLRSVFDTVECWQVHTNDLLLVASPRPLPHDLDALAARLTQPPFEDAMSRVLGVEGTAGFYASFVARPSLSTAIRDLEADRLNTDNHPTIEFGFARGLGRDLAFSVSRLAQLAARRGEGVPPARGASGIDPYALAEAKSARNAFWGNTTSLPPDEDRDFELRIAARNAWVRGELQSAATLWQRQPTSPQHPVDRLLLAESLAATGDPAFAAHADALEAAHRTAEAEMARARYHQTLGDPVAATRTLGHAFHGARTDPWVHAALFERTLQTAIEIARVAPAASDTLLDALSKPFAVLRFEDLRLRVRLELAQLGDFARHCRDVLAPFEIHPPWERDVLRLRLTCYELHDDRTMTARSEADLERFERTAPPRLLDP